MFWSGGAKTTAGWRNHFPDVLLRFLNYRGRHHEGEFHGEVPSEN